MTFYEWLRNIYVMKNNEKVTGSTIQKYVGVINTVSNDMVAIGLIDKRLDSMTITEYEVALNKILHNNDFLLKDNKGNKMYSNGLKRYRSYLYFNNDDLDELFDLPTREQKNTFRKKIIEKYNGECIISHLSIKSALVATHIKPLILCSDIEKNDGKNGILLSATFSKLFNAGLITFSNKGQLRISNLISEKNREILSIYNKMNTNVKLDEVTLTYLKYHEKYLFTN